MILFPPFRADFVFRPKIFHLNVEDNVETEIKKMMLSTVVFFLLMSHRVINKLFYN